MVSIEVKYIDEYITAFCDYDLRRNATPRPNPLYQQKNNNFKNLFSFNEYVWLRYFEG